ncbi:MAG: tRNA (adenosine(37)-N6)-dimethylallyltransferase MiaA [Microgenomates group bacterium]
MNKLLAIVGPTATGKTAHAVALAKKFNGELVSADSRQVYRGMDIGTGKDIETLEGIPMHLYDIVHPEEPFNISLYQTKAQICIDDIIKRKKLPIIVGGSGLYIHVLFHPLTIQVEPNETLRNELSFNSKEELQKKLQEVGKIYWDALNFSDRENPRRLIRKIEIAMGNQKEIKQEQCSYDVLQIGLRLDTVTLYSRIDERVEKRVSQGVIHEIQTLLDNGYGWDLPSMSSLGYRQWKPYFEKLATKESVIQQWKYDEHAYARRQMTWFRKDKTIRWFDIQKSGETDAIESLVASWYTHE